MSIKADFSEDEWKALEKGVIGAGMYVSVSEPDFTHTVSETGALATYVAGHRETSGSELVRELSNAHVNPLDFNASSWRIETETLAALRSAGETLAAKAPQEVAAYRDFVLGAADHVAQDRAGVRPREMAAIGKIREALGLQ
jgi:NAD(P)H-dependent flavin oxidoreductase YrpB (nitropropane dioxygenase family)